MNTPKNIIYIVVIAIAFCSVAYVATLIFLLAAKIPVEVASPVFNALKDAGTYFSGALTGLLINTRHAAVESQTTTTQTPDPNIP